MNVSFKPLQGLSKWLIFWLKVYVVVNLISIPDTLWTHYSFTRSLATLEISEQEIAEMLERMSDDEFSPPALNDQQQDDLLLTEQTFEADERIGRSTALSQASRPSGTTDEAISAPFSA